MTEVKIGKFDIGSKGLEQKTNEVEKVIKHKEQTVSSKQTIDKPEIKEFMDNLLKRTNMQAVHNNITIEN